MWHKIAVGLLAGIAAGAAAQPAWPWAVAGAGARDSVIAIDETGAGRLALETLTADGYGLATVDSVGPATVFVTPGSRLLLGRLDVVGVTLWREGDIEAGWTMRAGDPYVARTLATDLEAVVSRYAARGRLDARAVARPTFTPRDSAVVVDVTVVVDEGPVAESAGVELVGSARSTRRFASRLSGVAVGAPLDPYDPDAVRRSLEATGLYVAVGEPTLAREADRRVVIRVPVRDAPPGAFDLVVGYLPPTGGTPGRVVGSGRLALLNPFGGGRSGELVLVRNPGLVSRLDASVRDPFVAGLPLALDLAFAGESRDSTFSRQQVQGGLGVRLGAGATLTATLAREAVSPGRYGAQVVSGAPRVRGSDVWFTGVGIEVVSVDRRSAPRRGVVLGASVEQGIRRRSVVLDTLVSDSVRAQAQSPRQQRLLGAVRGYLPVTRRLGVVAGLDARLLVSGRGRGGEGGVAYDEGELFRYGGAQTLRGYDEDAFLGNAVGRLWGEVRASLDAASYAFGFVDLGYVATPALPSRAASRGLHPGYGAGLALGTGLGPVTVTYALNPDLPAGRGKVHVGLSLGL